MTGSCFSGFSGVSTLTGCCFGFSGVSTLMASCLEATDRAECNGDCRLGFSGVSTFMASCAEATEAARGTIDASSDALFALTGGISFEGKDTCGSLVDEGDVLGTGSCCMSASTASPIARTGSASFEGESLARPVVCTVVAAAAAAAAEAISMASNNPSMSAGMSLSILSDG